MPKSKRRWNEDDIAKLKAMAGKEPGDRIAAKLGRTLGATAVQASKRELAKNVRAELQTRPVVHQRDAFSSFLQVVEARSRAAGTLMQRESWIIGG